MQMAVTEDKSSGVIDDRLKSNMRISMLKMMPAKGALNIPAILPAAPHTSSRVI